MPMHQGLLPREGFINVSLWKLFARTALNPSLVLPVLLLAWYTKRGRDVAALHPTAVGRITSLLHLGIFRAVVNYLSDKTRNNWVADRYDWSREIVLITGGASGIGAAMVKLLDEHGIEVVVVDVLPLTFTTSSRVHHFLCDIRSPANVEELAEKVRLQVGQPTVLINNAGVARGKSILEAEPGDIRFTFDVNTLSHYWMAKAFLPNMIEKNHGMVVTVASVASWITAPGMVDYSASKAAAMAFHEGLSAELTTRFQASKIRTVIVHPGHTKTPLFEGFNEGRRSFVMPSLEVETLAEGVVKQILSGRSGNVILPGAGQILALLRVLPDWISYRFRATDRFMRKWNGRQVIADVNAAYETGVSSGSEESTVLISKE